MKPLGQREDQGMYYTFLNDIESGEKYINRIPNRNVSKDEKVP